MILKMLNKTSTILQIIQIINNNINPTAVQFLIKNKLILILDIAIKKTDEVIKKI